MARAPSRWRSLRAFAPGGPQRLNSSHGRDPLRGRGEPPPARPWETRAGPPKSPRATRARTTLEPSAPLSMPSETAHCKRSLAASLCHSGCQMYAVPALSPPLKQLTLPGGTEGSTISGPGGIARFSRRPPPTLARTARFRPTKQATPRSAGGRTPSLQPIPFTTSRRVSTSTPIKSLANPGFTQRLPYATELNRVEHAWTAVKRSRLAGAAPDDAN